MLKLVVAGGPCFEKDFSASLVDWVFFAGAQRG